MKIQSAILSKWWGQPIYLGAVVLLPKDYDKHPDVKYPIVYDEGHFSLRAPGGFTPPGSAPAGGRGGRGEAGGGVGGNVTPSGARGGGGGPGSFSAYWMAD